MQPATLFWRVRRVDQSVIDWVMALAFAGWGEIDYWVAGSTLTVIHGPRASATLFIAAVTLPLGLRRRWPLGVLCMVMGAIALDSLLVGKAAQGFVLFFPTMIATYSVAAHCDLRRALLGFAVGFTGSFIQVSLDPEVVTVAQLVVVQGFFFVTLDGMAWAAGRYVRGRRVDAATSEDRARRIERDQHELARAAVAEERGRIARELHDVIAHSVSLMGVQAGAVERVLERDPEQARETLRSIQATARESVGELRRLLGILRAEDEAVGLTPQPGLGALGALINDTRRAGLPVELSVEGEPRQLPAGVELSAYRVAQEALTNIRKHAPGASAQVLLRYHPHELEICIPNSATPPPNGAHETPPPGTGHGILGMHERVALYGGSLEAQALPDGGFVVRARLPLEVES